MVYPRHHHCRPSWIVYARVFCCVTVADQQDKACIVFVLKVPFNFSLMKLCCRLSILTMCLRSCVQVIKTPNAETPLASGAGTPLLTMDVWEHAYYLDVQNRRPDYIKTFLGELVNWDFVAEHYSSA